MNDYHAPDEKNPSIDFHGEKRRDAAEWETVQEETWKKINSEQESTS